ncbi:MAG: mRNA interferase RelE/StbE [Pseudonocardiales bacterium]|nr:mRNA interferase RelE/StbE [Pseudonocardiales bacterium]
MTELDRCHLVIAPAARRQLADTLPEAVAFAAYEFIVGPLLDNPQRVGKPVHEPLHDRHSARRGTYRIIYRIDEHARTVTVLAIMPRADAYRAP